MRYEQGDQVRFKTATTESDRFIYTVDFSHYDPESEVEYLSLSRPGMIGSRVVRGTDVELVPTTGPDRAA